MPDFILTTDYIADALGRVAQSDARIAAAIDLVGLPQERRGAQGFPVLLRVIVGQQLSTKAAATIAGRVDALMNNTPTPEKLLALDDQCLRGAGLSRQKVVYAKSLAQSVLAGPLDLDALPHMDDETAIKAITSVKGLGRWSAQMYLMFTLGRPDIWPVDDLAVQVAVGRIIGQKSRPKPKRLDMVGKKWAPERSSIALLAWHYVANAPAI